MERLIFLDTETTGLYPDKGDRICEIAAIEYINDKPTGHQFHTYLNPGKELSEEASRINGLTWVKLKDEPFFEDIAENFFRFVHGGTLVIHNARFDMGMIVAEIKKLPSPVDIYQSILEDVICTRQMAKNLFPYDKLSLDALCARFGIDISHRAIHGAMIDIKLLAKVYYKLKEVELARLPVTEDKPI